MRIKNTKSHEQRQHDFMVEAKEWWESKPRDKKWDDMNIPQKQEVIRKYHRIRTHPNWE